jgi:hypothetical protein
MPSNAVRHSARIAGTQKSGLGEQFSPFAELKRLTMSRAVPFILSLTHPGTNPAAHFHAAIAAPVLWQEMDRFSIHPAASGE